VRTSIPMRRSQRKKKGRRLRNRVGFPQLGQTLPWPRELSFLILARSTSVGVCSESACTPQPYRSPPIGLSTMIGLMDCPHWRVTFYLGKRKGARLPGPLRSVRRHYAGCIPSPALKKTLPEVSTRYVRLSVMGVQGVGSCTPLLMLP
jgi:hypothetical protein